MKPGIVDASSPAIVVRDTVVVGAALLAGTAPPSKGNVSGYIRGFDVRTGKKLWSFHTIAQPGKPGNETWDNESWKYTGNTGAWAPFSADNELGCVYLPIEMPTGDFYGGRTGKMIWYYQTVHHDIRDRDIAAPPILLDIIVDGRKIKAVAQPTRQAYTYVFDRTNGKPVSPIVERPVPQSDATGEKASPTQPIPTKPPAVDRRGSTLDDLFHAGAES